MALLVLAYPRIAQADYDWIQAVRAQHDARYFSLVAPHFTLVFPVASMEREGFSALVRLHDRLYTGALADELRLDITFIPHVGVGNHADARACKRVADELNARDFRVAGTIDTLDVVWHEHTTLRTIEQIALT
jgi:hypothetical protein